VIAGRKIELILQFWRNKAARIRSAIPPQLQDQRDHVRQ